MATLLFFGRFSDVMEDRTQALPGNVTDTEGLVEWLGQQDERFAGLMAQKGMMIAINQDIVRGPHPVTDTDEIAFLSPLSGG